MERIEGKIAAILDHTTVVINRGSRDGVSRGDEFYIFSEAGPFFDPDTGEELGTIIAAWCKVTVSNVEERLCLARSDYQPIIDSGWITRMLGSRVRLPVDEGEIVRELTKIKVGSPAILEKRPRVVTEEEVETLPAPSEEEPGESTPSQIEGNALTERDTDNSLSQ